MLVELLGLPGSGKSTLLRGLLPHLRGQGIKACSAERLEDMPSEDPAAPRYIRGNAGRTSLYRAQTFRGAYPKMISHIETQLDMEPAQHFLFNYTGTLYQAAQEYAPKFAAMFLDEGFTHRGVYAHLDADDALFTQYLQLVPLPDMVLNVCPPPRTALRRAIHRRKAKTATRKKVFAKLGDQTAFRRRHGLIEISLDTLKARGVQVLDIDTSLDLDTCLDHVSSVIVEKSQMKTAALGLSTAAE